MQNFNRTRMFDINFLCRVCTKNFDLTRLPPKLPRMVTACTLTFRERSLMQLLSLPKASSASRISCSLVPSVRILKAIVVECDFTKQLDSYLSG